MLEYSFITYLVLFNLFFLINFNYISRILNLYDHPDHKRKIHNKKISCIGGVFIFVNLTIFFVFYLFFDENFVSKNFFEIQFSSFIFFYISLAIIFLMGLLDDKYSLKPNIKILILSLTVIFLLITDQNLRVSFLRFSFLNNVYDISNFSIFFTTLCMLVFINAFNMYDGSNLQVSSISIVIFLYLLIVQNSIDYFLITLIVSLAIFSFLNFKNKLFLGDNGSLVLSFIICYVFIKLYSKGIIFYADQVCLFMILPVIDLLRVFIVRIYNGKSPFEPDRNHIHHILISRFNIYYTQLILFSIYLVPVSFGFFTQKFFISIIFQIIIYLVIYLNFRKKKKNVK